MKFLLFVLLLAVFSVNAGEDAKCNKLEKAVNRYRGHKGLPLLKCEARLRAVSLFHTVDYSKSNNGRINGQCPHGWFHYAKCCSQCFEVIFRKLFKHSWSDYFTAIGENTYWATPRVSIPLAIAGWHKSLPHQKTMSSKTYNSVGCWSNRNFAVCNFGK